MRTTILTILSTALIVTATAQIADAAQKSRKTHHTPAATSEQFRNSNASWQQPSADPYWPRYTGGFSAPAGH